MGEADLDVSEDEDPEDVRGEAELSNCETRSTSDGLSFDRVGAVESVDLGVVRAGGSETSTDCIRFLGC